MATRRTPARRERPLGLEAIVDVTLRIIDADGVQAVSMRRVAAEFDTGPASLYAYVSGKDELLSHALERVLRQVPMPKRGPWRKVVRKHAFDVRAVLQQHRDIAFLTFGVIPESEHFTDLMEVMLECMISQGVPPQAAAWLLDVLALYVSADAYEGYLMGQRLQDGSGRPLQEVAQEYFAGFTERLAAMPAERYPYVTTHIPELLNGSGDDRFGFGVDMLLAGVAAQIEDDRSAKRAPRTRTADR